MAEKKEWMSKGDSRYGKNLQNVQDMVDGSYKGKIQVATHVETDIHANRKVGDIWTDSDGKKWEQREGYRSSVKSTPNVGVFSKACKDCNTNCGISKINNSTFMRQQRCYYCQISFESKLKSRKIGETNSKHFFWVRLMELQRWIAGRDELQHWIYQNHEEKKTQFDMSVANAMANENLEMSIKKNT